MNNKTNINKNDLELISSDGTDTTEAIKKNLKDQILTDDNTIMYCSVCGAENSANSGDYWNVPDDHKFICCDEVMSLVTKHIDITYKKAVL